MAWNDTVFHRLAIKMVVEAIKQGQDFTDPWQGSMGMGFPLFHYYQHFPHVTIALVHVLTLGLFAIADLLNWTNYLLLSHFPISIYWSLRRFDFDQLSAAMGGLVASLVATAGIGGLSFASYVFQGWGGSYPALGNVAPAPGISFRIPSSERGERILLGNAIPCRNVDLPPDIRVYGLPYPWHPHTYPTYRIIQH